MVSCCYVVLQFIINLLSYIVLLSCYLDICIVLWLCFVMQAFFLSDLMPCTCYLDVEWNTKNDHE